MVAGGRYGDAVVMVLLTVMLSLLFVDGAVIKKRIFATFSSDIARKSTINTRCLIVTLMRSGSFVSLVLIPLHI